MFGVRFSEGRRATVYHSFRASGRERPTSNTERPSRPGLTRLPTSVLDVGCSAFIMAHSRWACSVAFTSTSSRSSRHSRWPRRPPRSSHITRSRPPAAATSGQAARPAYFSVLSGTPSSRKTCQPQRHRDTETNMKSWGAISVPLCLCGRFPYRRGRGTSDDCRRAPRDDPCRGHHQDHQETVCAAPFQVRLSAPARIGRRLYRKLRPARC